LSVTTPDGYNISSIVPSQPDKEQDVNLSDLSEKDKVWDKHRANSDCIADYYRGSKYSSYANRIDDCSQLLDFKLSPSPEDGELKLKLSSVKFCRVRHCPVCQWRRSLMWKAKAYQFLPKVVADYPKHRWLFLTLTVKNCPIQDLKKTLAWMNKSFTRLTQLKDWFVDGWIKSVEVTRGRDGNAHPHFHCLLMVPPSYFSGQNYLSQDAWVELWQKCARLDYKPVCHVRAIAKHNDPKVIIPEILKYQVKESDLVANREWFLELTKQMHKSRAVAVGGVLRIYMSELEQEPEDLIGQGDELASDEGHLYFQWKSERRKYKLKE
jgi:plasmid rolling circle replication initiator protein Rep